MHLAKRQGPINAPTNVSGIATAVTTVDTSIAASASDFLFDPSATTGSISAPPLDITNTNTGLITPTPTPTPTPTQSSTPTAVAAAATKPIALSTVIATCVGAFIGASALIIVGLLLYRRYSRSLKSRANARGPLVHTRNLHGDEQRRRSRLEPWNKLDDGDDKWEDMYQTSERKDGDHVAPMEKLTMFKKTPSVRTAYTHKSTDVSAFDFPQSYAEFDPKLAQTLSFGKTQMPEPRPFLGRVDTPPVNSVSSWDTETVGNGSYLSTRELVGGAMSPSLHMAIPTPPATISQAHKWESAEVVHYSDAHSVEPIDPFASQNGMDSRQSTHNPFFNAQDYEPHTRSRSNSVTKSPKAKGKERMRYSTASSAADPFDDINQHMPRPTFIRHAAAESSSSIESKERALHSLIAALDVSEQDARDRLRIASMQPSIISQTYSIGGYEEDVTREFPLPRTGGSSRP
jgi:hypothetical protein